MKTRITTIYVQNILLFCSSLGVVAFSAAHYSVPLPINVVCSFVYGWLTSKMFPWVSVRVE